MGTAVATTNGTEKKGIAATLTSDAAREYILPFLPPGSDLNRIVAAALLAAKQNPDLNLCTTGSIVTAVAKIQQWGLEIGDTAHLVPFNVNVAPKGAAPKWEKRAQAIADYKGLAQLIWRSGAVRNVEARPVYEREHFLIEYGLAPKLEHVPQHRSTDRGKLIGAYVIFFLPFGQRSFHFMGIEDIDAIRKKHSKQWKDGECPPWYAMKTVIRQGVKLLPKDPRLAEALKVTREDELEELDEIPATPAVASLADPKADEPATGEGRNPDEFPGDDELEG